jgi:hypothetical protein
MISCKILEIYVCNMRFERNISLLLGRIEACRHVKFTSVELAGCTELASGTQRAR